MALFDMDKKQMWESIRFIVAVVFTAGVLYATVTAAVSDISEVKIDLQAKTQAADVTHEKLELRLRPLEEDRAANVEWRKHVTESLQRIERKIEGGGKP